jgi:nucleoside-diphosphate-sugar epimerase
MAIPGNMTERRKIFLLGGTGFIGTALTKQLSANRQTIDLLMLIHRSAPFRELEQVNLNTGSLGSFDLALFDRFQPDTIMHLARMSGRGRWGRSWAALRGAWANRRIIRHLERQKVRPHTIYVSGTLVYGDCGETPVDEDHPINPTAFAREYIRAEKPWMAKLEEGALPVSILRPSWIMGAGSWFAGFYLKSIREHRMVPLFGDGRNIMSLLDVEDCAGLIAHAASHAQPGRCYNLFCPGACLTQLKFAERLAEYTGCEIRRFSREEARRRFGQTSLEAFTFSNLSATRSPEFLGGYEFKHPSVDAMMQKNIPAELQADHRFVRKE